MWGRPTCGGLAFVGLAMVCLSLAYFSFDVFFNGLIVFLLWIKSDPGRWWGGLEVWCAWRPWGHIWVNDLLRLAAKILSYSVVSKFMLT